MILLYCFFLGPVDLVPCLGYFMRPLDVAVASCGYRLTAGAVRPGHFLSWLLCIALMRVSVSRMSRH